MHVRFSHFVVALVAVALTAATSAAQISCGNTNAATASCTPAGTQVTVTVQNIVRLTVTSTSAALTAPTDANFTAGGTTTIDDVDLQELLVRANVDWALTATAGPWDAVNSYTKATGDAAFSITGGAPYTAFTGGIQAVTTGTATAGSAIDISYRVTWSLALDEPGSYVLPIAFTISST